MAIAIGLLASFLFAITNHIDKYMLSKIENNTSNIKSLLVFSSLIAGICLSPIWLCVCKFDVNTSNIAILLAFVSAIIYVLATYLYFKALEKNDTSLVVAFFQLIPVFSFILELIFLNETLQINELVGMVIIIISAIFISLEFEEKKNNNKFIALILMTFSSLFFSLYFFVFDISMRIGNYNKTTFWYQIGLLLVGLVLISIKGYRSSFKEMIIKNKKKIISLNILNETINLLGNIFANLANVLIPLAIVNALNGFQSAFAFVIGVIGVIFAPKLFKEDLGRKNVMQKLICIILGIFGLIIMV